MWIAVCRTAEAVLVTADSRGGHGPTQSAKKRRRAPSGDRTIPEGDIVVSAMVERNAQIETRLVEDLFDVSRLTSSKLQLQTEPLDLVEVTGHAIEAIRPS